MMIKKNLSVAAIQMNSVGDKAKNLVIAIQFLQEAISNGAKFIVFPEVFNFRGDCANPEQQAENIPGPSTKILMSIAAEKKVWILAGSIYEASKIQKKFYNSSVLIDDSGQIKAVYRKIHLFDASLANKKILESNIFLRGSKPILTSVLGVKTGLSICYDLRFPELYRKYSEAGAKILCIPSAFTFMTGQSHWEILLRARAIENQCFVIAPNQCRTGKKNVLAYGNSMIVGPWGEIIARASANFEGVVYAKLDMSRLNAVRANLPALTHRRIR